jgi:prepilin-type N-terminal cleavage/methylation domain-containing protein
MNHRASFTLIELLVTIAIVAIVSVVIVLTLNPAQLLKQARDSNRLSDLQTLTKAVSLFETDQPGGFIGTSTVVYVSVPDPAATSTLGSDCAALGLPILPSGWTYRCAASSTFQKTDGTGWVPVDLDQMSFRTLAALPVDPLNTTSSGDYYTYVIGGSFEFTATAESAKHRGPDSYAGRDGGQHHYSFEVGSNLRLTPSAVKARSEDPAVKDGLALWWTFDEGSGTSTNDMSGNSHNGTLVDGPTWQEHAGCRLGRCLDFDGSNDYVNVAISMTPSNPLSVSLWVRPSSLPNPSTMWTFNSTGLYFGAMGSNMTVWQNAFNSSLSYSIGAGNWYHFVVVREGDNISGGIKIYANGSLISTKDSATLSSITSFRLGARDGSVIQLYAGRIDDVRIYSRALSAAEIAAIYNAQK